MPRMMPAMRVTTLAWPITSLVTLLELGCAGGRASEGGEPLGSDDEVESEGGGSEDGEGATLELPAAGEVDTGRVATAATCSSCHANSPSADAMRDEAGQAIAPFDLWRSSMMANAARDPFWHAMVEAETLATPAAAAAIEAKCTQCHAPLLAAEHQLTDAGPVTIAMLFEDTPAAKLGLDGVSCTLCHQIEDQQLGDPASFSGHWVVAGEGRIYGPHADPFTMPMQNHTGKLPVEGHQIEASALCGTCHTLITDALDPQGQATGGRLAEQTPYLEWRNSAFSTERAQVGPDAISCQGCHVPRSSLAGLPITTRIARRPMGDDFPPIDAREPYGRHVFVGGNTLMLAILRDNAEALRPNAPREAFDATLVATREQLEHASAELVIESAPREGDTLRVGVRARALTGHKFPTGFPSRRAFLQVEVRDAADELVFMSGAFDARGRLLDEQGEVRASELAGGPLEPHRARIDDPAQVQVWEAVMADAASAPTFRLLRGEAFAKDNRLLPRGWDDALAGPDIAPVGLGDDATFDGEGDLVELVVVAPPASGPYQVEVRLYYQPLAPRFAAELFALEGAKIRAFEAMLAKADLAPERVASATASVE